MVKIEPFSKTLPKIREYQGPMIAYGTTTLIRNVDRDRSWVPGLWFDSKEFKPSSWSSKMGEDSLNKGKILSIKDVSFMFETEKYLFIRPNSDLKIFSGNVFTVNDYNRLINNIKENNYVRLSLHTEVIVSTPLPIRAEWRFVIVDGKVITGSQYRLMGRLKYEEKVDPEAWKLAEKIANKDWQVSKAYVLDIALVKDEYKVIEVNCVNASGFYKCNITEIIKSLSQLAKAEWKRRTI